MNIFTPKTIKENLKKQNARNNAIDFYKYCRYDLGLSHVESLSKAKLIDSSFRCQDGEY